MEPTHEPSGGAGGQEPPPTPSSPASDMLPSDVEGLQAANKRLALENDTLRSMNASLREELASLEAQQQARSAAHTATSQEGAARQAELDASQERVRILTGRLKALEHATGQLPHSDSLQLPEVDLQRPVDELFDELSDALVRLDEAGGNIRLGLQAWMDAFHSKLHDEMGGAFPSSEDNRRLALCVNRTSHRFGIRAWSSYRERPASLKWDASNERFALSLPEHHGAGRSTASASKALPRIELRYL